MTNDQPDDDGLHKTPPGAVDLAPGRTPEQADAVREAVEEESDITETWDKTDYHEQTSEDTRRYRLLLEHEDGRVSIFVKELPNGTQLRLRVAADQPGEWAEVYQEDYHDTPLAVARAGYFAARYDVAGEWPVEQDDPKGGQA